MINKTNKTNQIKDKELNMIRFNYSDYERSHGKSPKGYGSWIYTINRISHHTIDYLFCNGTIGEVKKRLRKKYAGKNLEIFILG